MDNNCINPSQSKTKGVTITVTEKCNLACSYCYEHNKGCRKVDIDIAKRIIKDELQKDDGTSAVHLDFFGGEPFCEFDIIKELVAYIKSIYFDKTVYMYAATNGTLVHGHIQKWLEENQDCFSCSLSIDGTREMHNKNRSNSFDLIDLNFFSRLYRNQPIKMTISKETLPSLYDGVVFLHRQGFDVHCNLAQGIDWSAYENVAILETELRKLIDFYISNPEIKPCSLLDRDISLLVCMLNDEVRHKWCGAGTHMNVYNVDGNKYPCHFFMPISIGIDKSQSSKNIEFRDYIPIGLLDENCQHCAIEPLCPTCYGSNYERTGNIYSKDADYCRLTKIIIRAQSLFKAMQWERGLLKLDNDTEQLLLRSIMMIQDNLQLD